MLSKTLHWKDRSHRFTPHFHVEFYVGVIVRGVCEFQCSGRDHVAAAGDLVLINPYEVHTAGCSPDVEYRAVYLDEQTVERVVKAAPEAGAVLSLEPTVVKQSPDAAGFAAALADSRALADISAPLSSILTRHAAARELNVDTREFQQRVMAYMDSYLTDAFGTPPISDLAAEFGMTPQTFSRVFHRIFGVPAVFFRNQVRLHLAEERLAQGGKAGDIAFECGFSDQAHLTRELKKSRGVTPKLYATAYQTLSSTGKH
jgi:AraC-like DNA-binding protein